MRERLARLIEARIAPELAIRVSPLATRLDALERGVAASAHEAVPRPYNLLVPLVGLAEPVEQPFMAYSSCSAADFQTAQFAAICTELARGAVYHRKLWEWVFIVHHLRRLGMVAPGRRGLGFGVGTETLPSLFAKHGAEVVATDAPPEIGVQAGWTRTGQFAAKLEDIREASIIDAESFARLVTYETCDMAAIPGHLTGFDFCWSSCCLEHLGSLEAGLDFIIHSVEQTLRPGGIACHTTELNLSSDIDTVESGATVIYRKQDLLRLVARLEARGHSVEPFRIAPDRHPLDFFVDMPPYLQNPHLRLKLQGFITTSAGLVIRRGT